MWADKPLVDDVEGILLIPYLIFEPQHIPIRFESCLKLNGIPLVETLIQSLIYWNDGLSYDRSGTFFSEAILILLMKDGDKYEMGHM